MSIEACRLSSNIAYLLHRSYRSRRPELPFSSCLQEGVNKAKFHRDITNTIHLLSGLCSHAHLHALCEVLDFQVRPWLCVIRSMWLFE